MATQGFFFQRQVGKKKISDSNCKTVVLFYTNLPSSSITKDLKVDVKRILENNVITKEGIKLCGWISGRLVDITIAALEGQGIKRELKNVPYAIDVYIKNPSMAIFQLRYNTKILQERNANAASLDIFRLAVLERRLAIFVVRVVSTSAGYQPVSDVDQSTFDTGYQFTMDQRQVLETSRYANPLLAELEDVIPKITLEQDFMDETARQDFSSSQISVVEDQIEKVVAEPSEVPTSEDAKEKIEELKKQIQDLEGQVSTSQETKGKTSKKTSKTTKRASKKKNVDVDADMEVSPQVPLKPSSTEEPKPTNGEGGSDV